MSLPSDLFAALATIAARPALALLALLAGALGFSLGCAGSGPALRDIDREPGALRAWFEREQSHPRAVLLLSPV
jgi:hypothetical protein